MARTWERRYSRSNWMFRHCRHPHHHLPHWAMAREVRRTGRRVPRIWSISSDDVYGVVVDGRVNKPGDGRVSIRQRLDEKYWRCEEVRTVLRPWSTLVLGGRLYCLVWWIWEPPSILPMVLPQPEGKDETVPTRRITTRPMPRRQNSLEKRTSW